MEDWRVWVLQLLEPNWEAMSGWAEGWLGLCPLQRVSLPDHLPPSNWADTASSF